jgi:hypothetical protein
VFASKIKRFHAVSGLDRRISGRLDKVAKELHIELIVFYNHYLFGHDGCPYIRS